MPFAPRPSPCRLHPSSFKIFHLTFSLSPFSIHPSAFSAVTSPHPPIENSQVSLFRKNFRPFFKIFSSCNYVQYIDLRRSFVAPPKNFLRIFWKLLPPNPLSLRTLHGDNIYHCRVGPALALTHRAALRLSRFRPFASFAINTLVVVTFPKACV